MIEHVGDLAVCELRLAVERPGRPAGPSVVTVTCFGRLAVLAAERLTVGDLVGVTGWLRTQPADTDDGSARQRVDVVAERLDFLGHPIAPSRGPRRAPRGRLRRPLRARRGVVMIVYSDRTVVTCAVLDWADVEPSRMAWLAGCLARHLTADWGDLDADDRAANDHALRRRPGPGPVRLPAPRRARRHHRRDARCG